MPRLALLLSNFCEALPLASIKPKRILLQSGPSNYESISPPILFVGLTARSSHLGPTSVPQEEFDPRVTLELNSYAQEDYL